MILLHNATIVTAAKEGIGSILIDGDTINKVFWKDTDGTAECCGAFVPFDNLPSQLNCADVVDLTGKHIIAGGIDAHVHFREPGLTHKADMETESRAAVAGGVTTVFDMPNTSPATVSAEALAGKMELAKTKSLAKTAFHIGATNSNVDEICRIIREGDSATGIKASDIPGVKVFMGSSTGNMLLTMAALLANCSASRKSLFWSIVRTKRQSRLISQQQRKNTERTSRSKSMRTSEAARPAYAQASRLSNLPCSLEPDWSSAISLRKKR
jgi:dihydroorotase-like cyclic amidohydrolase